MTPGQGPEEDKAPETEDGNSDPAENQEDSNPEENPVMNFFKTLVSDTILEMKCASCELDICNRYSCKIRLLG